MIWYGLALFIIDTLTALSFIAAFPVICMTTNIRLACCLLTTGLVVHFVIHHWYPQFSIGVAHMDDDPDSTDDYDDYDDPTDDDLL